MKKLLARVDLQFGVIVLMCLVSFITFNIIFSQTKDGGYFKEVIAAMIGALLTVVITFILWNHQQRNEEVKEQNIEVFKKRIERYEEVTTLLVAVRENGVSKSEAKRLTKAIYNLALLSSEETLSTVSQFASDIVFEEKDGVSLLEVISCFRKELNLKNVDEFSVDIVAVEKLLANGFDKTDFRKIRDYLSNAADQISSAFEERMTPAVLNGYEFSEFVGQGASSYFVITSATSKLQYNRPYR